MSEARGGIQRRHQVAGAVLYVAEPRAGARPPYWDYGRLFTLS
jgi:hypothetical protein